MKSFTRIALSIAIAAPFTLGAAADGNPADKVARGKYLVTTSGCNDCHTPWKMGSRGPEPDMTRMLSGHPESDVLPPPPSPSGPWIVSSAATNTAFSGPWGISYTANLTPDPDTGLGKWTQQNFTQTIRTGRHMGRGRAILPPMPIPMYKHFNDEDLQAIFTYLQSIPAVKNRVPEPAAAKSAPAKLSAIE
jgi:mono/diheme cytochrome c family protein